MRRARFDPQALRRNVPTVLHNKILELGSCIRKDLVSGRDLPREVTPEFGVYMLDDIQNGQTRRLLLRNSAGPSQHLGAGLGNINSCKDMPDHISCVPPARNRLN